MLFISWLINIILIFLRVAFYTIFERKILGLFHLRLGPNKVRFQGLFQPLLDAFKLLSKQDLIPFSSRKWIYIFSPIIRLFISISIWRVLPITFFSISIPFSWILFYLFSSLLVLPIIFCGWSSISKYRLIGALRAVAQSISYEAVIRTLFVFILIFLNSYRINSIISLKTFFFTIILPIWIICILAELHRAPFDFRESESELVSGFNTEYRGVSFAMFFLGEYSVLLIACFILTYLFLPYISNYSFLFTLILTLFFSFIFIWIRSTYCRFRYDLLIIFSWKYLLPISLIFFILNILFIYL